MSRLTPAALVALTALLVVGLLFPAGAVAGLGTSATDSASSTDATTAQQANGTEVSVDVGEQLSTVTTTTSEDIRTGAENAGFEQRIESANATDRAKLIAERAAELENTSETLRAEYVKLTNASKQSEISVDRYAQRIAALSAAATNVDQSVQQLSDRAAQLSAAERRAVGVTEDNLATITEGINPLTGRTASAVLAQFTGQNAGEIEIEVGDRIELSVQSDGERSRQFERPRDSNGAATYDLNQSQALEIATAALSQPASEWTITGVSTDDGAYEFEFRYTGPGEGEAEVSVDGSTGTVFALEESIEAPESDDAEDEDEDDEEAQSQRENLAIGLSDGEPAPGANVTLLVTGNGGAVANATVTVNGEVVGTTDEAGQITVTLPTREEIDIEAELNDAEGELEFEFENEDEEDELGATADIDGETITVFVVLDGQPVEGATVALNENVTETTGPDGTASFTITGNELDINIEYEGLEAELEYELDADEDDEKEEDESDGEENEGEDEGEDKGEEEDESEDGDETEDDGDDTESDETEDADTEDSETDDEETEDDEEATEDDN